MIAPGGGVARDERVVKPTNFGESLLHGDVLVLSEGRDGSGK